MAINKLSISSFNKNFLRCFINNENLKLYLSNIYLPFGGEKYLDKIIINIEFDNENIHHNIVSKLDTIDNKILEKKYEADIASQFILNTRGYMKSLKESKCGHIQRTHLLKNTDIYIGKSDGEKINIDYSSLKKTYCDIEIQLKGIWLTENNYGLYWVVNSIKVLKFV